MAKPSTSNLPPLEDPHNIKEVFACEVAAFAVGHGTMRVSFATRIIEPRQPDDTPNVRRIVVARIVLDQIGADQLLAKLEQLKALIASQKLSTTTDKPN